MEATDTKIATVNDQIECGLFTLPAEIRNEIYAILFALPLDHSGRLALIDSPKNPEIPTVFSVLQTCRRIRNEAIGLLYSENHILLRGEFRTGRWSYGTQFSGFIKASTQQRFSAIRTLTVVVDELEYMTLAIKSLSQFDHLTALTFSWDLNRRCPRDPSYDLGVFEREKHFLIPAARKFLPASLLEPKIQLYISERHRQFAATQVLLDEISEMLDKWKAVQAKKADRSEAEAPSDGLETLFD